MIFDQLPEDVRQHIEAMRAGIRTLAEQALEEAICQHETCGEFSEGAINWADLRVTEVQWVVDEPYKGVTRDSFLVTVEEASERSDKLSAFIRDRIINKGPWGEGVYVVTEW